MGFTVFEVLVGQLTKDKLVSRNDGTDLGAPEKAELGTKVCVFPAEECGEGENEAEEGAQRCDR